MPEAICERRQVNEMGTCHFTNMPKTKFSGYQNCLLLGRSSSPPVSVAVRGVCAEKKGRRWPAGEEEEEEGKWEDSW